MKIAKLRLVQEPNKSFIVHKETDPFTPWHHHPEYEIVLIVKGKGRRMVGDHVDRFEECDLVFLGPYLPHAWIVDGNMDKDSESWDDEAFVIQFNHNFLGDQFFEIPEHTTLKKFLLESVRGYKFYGNTKRLIIAIMNRMKVMNDLERLYALLRIFHLFGFTEQYKKLASPAYNVSFAINGNETMRTALQYIMEHFQEKIQIRELLKITHMSYAAFYPAFKKTYGMSFTNYLLKLRVGYSCKLLAEDQCHISEIAYDSGFDNLANFNRQFKKIKGITPSKYRNQFRENGTKEISEQDELIERWGEAEYQ